jgi:hypothetical protein
LANIGASFIPSHTSIQFGTEKNHNMRRNAMKPGTPGSDPLLLHLDPWTFPKHDDRKRIAAKLRKEIQEVEFELEHEVELIKALEGQNQDLLIQLADLKRLQNGLSA